MSQGINEYAKLNCLMTLDTTVRQKEENIELKSSHRGCKLCMVKIRVKCTASGGALNFLLSAKIYLELITVSMSPTPPPKILR